MVAVSTSLQLVTITSSALLRARREAVPLFGAVTSVRSVSPVPKAMQQRAREQEQKRECAHEAGALPGKQDQDDNHD